MAEVERLKGTSAIERLISCLNVPEMLDCTFIVGEEKEQIKANKVLLSAASEVFERTFFGEMSTNEPIEIPDVEPRIFKRFLRLCIRILNEKRAVFKEDIVSEEDVINREDAIKIFSLADMYMIKSLIELLVRTLRPKTADEFYENLKLSSCFHSEELLDSSILYFLRSNVNIFDDKPFLDVSPNVVVRIFKEDHLAVYSEVQLFYAALKWASAQCQKKSISDESSNLRKVLEEEGILKHIRFLTMSLDDFMNGPFKSGVLTDEESSAIISNIKRCVVTHSLPDTLSQLRSGRWIKWTGLTKWKTANIFLSSENYEKISESESRFLYLDEKNINICGVTLSPRSSRHPSDGEEYDEHVTVRVFRSEDTLAASGKYTHVCTGEYKGKVRFDTSVYVFFNGEPYCHNFQKLLFRVKFMNEQWHKCCLPSAALDDLVFEHKHGLNTIMKIHYCYRDLSGLDVTFS